MENIAYLLFFLSMIGVLFIVATIIAVGDYSFNAGFRTKICLIISLGYLATKSFLWVKAIKNENKKDN